MPVPVLTFFNNKGGVGKTSLVYHLSSMFAELGLRVVVVDLDPQANLTAAFLDEDTLLSLWDGPNTEASSIYPSIRPLIGGKSDFAPIQLQQINTDLGLIAGNLALSSFEDLLSQSWTEALDDAKYERAFLLLTAFWRIAQDAADRFAASLIIFDVGPNLGAINRSALLASNFVAVPLGADLFSLQGLRNLGPSLRQWRKGWNDRKERAADKLDFAVPPGDMKPIGYIAMRHGVRLSRPVKAYTRWLEKIPEEFRKYVLDQNQFQLIPSIENDENCLAMLKNYQSLMPLSQEARKPIFALRAADGAIGSHANAVSQAYQDFKELAKKIAVNINISIM